jgi:hypothetical protein
MRWRFASAGMPDYRSPYEDCPELCTRFDNPGAPLDSDRFLDSSKKPTTVDQSRIEDVIDTMRPDRLRILHVGVGNSSLAKRVARRAAAVIGATLSSNEKELADSLRLPQYSVFVANKYGREFPSLAGKGHHLIVDNNLASFACCKFHFYRMMDSYLGALNTGGRILTDQRGMDWVAGDARWKLTYSDLEALERKFPLRAARISESVYSLTKSAA